MTIVEILPVDGTLLSAIVLNDDTKIYVKGIRDLTGQKVATNGTLFQVGQQVSVMPYRKSQLLMLKA